MYSGDFETMEDAKPGWAKDANGKWIRISQEGKDKRRFAKTTWKVIDRLLASPALNIELAKISLKYTGRISDARKLGFIIKCTRKDKIGKGVTEYRIIQPYPVVTRPSVV